MQMSLNTPTKVLNRIDIKLPDNVVKGAVVLDPGMIAWNPSAQVMDPTAPKTAFITIDKEAEDLEDLKRRVAQELRLPTGEKYGLLFEDPKAFLTPTTLIRLEHGFMLNITASPDHYVNRLRVILTDFSAHTTAELERAVKQLDLLSSDRHFVEHFYASPGIKLLYSLIDNGGMDSSETIACHTLRAMSNMLDLRVDDIGWEKMPDKVVRTLAILVTGGAKREDSNTLLLALGIIEQLANCESPHVRTQVLSVVPMLNLIRHLEKSNEAVALAALSLMNTLHRISDQKRKAEIIGHLDSVPFRTAIAGSVLRGNRSRERSLLDQIVPLQRLLLDQYIVYTHEWASEEDVLRVVNNELIKSSMTSEEVQFEEWCGLLRNSERRRLTLRTIERMADLRADEMRTIISENSMRVGGGGRWQLIPMAILCVDIVANLLGVVQQGDDCVDYLVELLFATESSFDALFATTMQLFHRTWREMQAAEGEADKVSGVVRMQLWRAAESRPGTVAALEDKLRELPYWKMQEIWKKEQLDRERNQLGSESVKELRDLLRPSIENLVRTNRKNFMKQGYTFKKYSKKSISKDLFWFWKLDPSEKILCMTETDMDPFDEQASSDTARKVVVKDIINVRGDEGRSTTRKGGLLRAIHVELEKETLTATAPSDVALCTWVDGLRDLIGQKDLSNDAQKTVDRLLNVELRLRLVDVPEPLPAPTPPTLPTDFSWLMPVLNST